MAVTLAGSATSGSPGTRLHSVSLRMTQKWSLNIPYACKTNNTTQWAVLQKIVLKIQKNILPTDRRIEDVLSSLSSLLISREAKRASLV